MTEEITFRSDMKVELMNQTGTDESIIQAAKISTSNDEAVNAMSEEGKLKFINFLAEGLGASCGNLQPGLLHHQSSLAD